MPEIGKRIKKRREELGITQGELASRLGYKNKTTIAKIENGTNDIVQSKVKEFANALDTTPAYLMGWEQPLDYIIDQESQSTAHKDMLTNENQILIETYEDLTKDNKCRLLAYAKKLMQLQCMEEDTDIELAAAHDRTDIEVTEEMKKHDDDIMNDNNF